MLNKPAGVISATEDTKERCVVDLIESRMRKDLFPVGRLDKDTEGLLVDAPAKFDETGPTTCPTNMPTTTSMSATSTIATSTNPKTFAFFLAIITSLAVMDIL